MASKTVEKVIGACETCGAKTSVYPRDARRGSGRFCSRSCRSKDPIAVARMRAGIKPTEKVRVVGTCRMCGAETRVRPSAARNGRGVYCSQLCSAKAGGTASAATLPTKLDRFTAKITGMDDPAACWLWQGSTANGYGRVSQDDVRKYAHRTAYELWVGPVPDGLWVLHKCDVRACVNPAHLFLGTSGDNVRDMYAKGRGRWGAHCVPGSRNKSKCKPVTGCNL